VSIVALLWITGAVLLHMRPTVRTSVQLMRRFAVSLCSLETMLMRLALLLSLVMAVQDLGTLQLVEQQYLVPKKQALLMHEHLQRRTKSLKQVMF